ncbi:DUF1900-domain-containing protein [Rhizoclosmatium globosum]|uniref:DUF1900-domain-containing protein n=1 Tax=Rhizoclosmatium globosum TaxID=329046 RepID=A0A1Y2CUM7_9FUNG|nr:DUF1900-domain-containing protein [Rhizoclosmatium globosum]|eukprot:ORY50596.1 DUF1900-domain-containing protein [Rhizoclosmatium globosum]
MASKGSVFKNATLKEGLKEVLPTEGGRDVSYAIAVDGTGAVTFGSSTGSTGTVGTGETRNIGSPITAISASPTKGTAHSVLGTLDGRRRSSIAASKSFFGAAAAAGEQICVVDLARAKTVANWSAAAGVSGLSWSSCGSSLAAISKDALVRVWDPRTSLIPVATSGYFHISNKPSSVLWLSGGLDSLLLTTGTSKGRDRECALWDKVDSAGGTLMPLFDEDSKLLFLAGRGESTIRTYEVTSSAITQTPTAFMTSRPILAATLAPKPLLDVMDCEVARLMIVGSGSNGSNVVFPVKVNVERKDKSEFQTDLFPDTTELNASLSATQWLSGINGNIVKVSLDPTKPVTRTVVQSTPPPLTAVTALNGRSTPVSRSGTPVGFRSSTPNRMAPPTLLSTTAYQNGDASSPVSPYHPIPEHLRMVSPPPAIAPAIATIDYEQLEKTFSKVFDERVKELEKAQEDRMSLLVGVLEKLVGRVEVLEGKVGGVLGAQSEALVRGGVLDEKVGAVLTRISKIEEQVNWVPALVETGIEKVLGRSDLEKRLREMEVSVVEKIKSELEVVSAKVTADVGVLVSDAVENVAEREKEKEKEAKRSSLRIAAIPNMGISTQLSKLKEMALASGGGLRSASPGNVSSEEDGVLSEEVGEQVVKHEA